MAVIDWRCEALPEMSATALYRVLKLRSEVFVVEQQCIYLDPDGLDEGAWHLQALDASGALLAYARLLAPEAAASHAQGGLGGALGGPAGGPTGVPAGGVGTTPSRAAAGRPGQPAARIGRVITAPSARGTGLGRQLMQQALVACERLWPGMAIELGAQAHLQDFYASFGFTAISDVYDEDGIPHIDMRRPVPG